MPLIVLSGQPSSGKSTIAGQLRGLLQARGATVHLVDEPTAFIDKNHAYKTGFDEKNSRAKLKSEVDRLISKKDFIILDTLNNIKGYRYELWCSARAAATRYCMVHVDTPVDKCRQWNQQREDKYEDAVFDDLAGRYERPDSCNRWDSPLFTVRPGELDEESVLAAVVSVMTEAESANPQQQVAKTLKPTCATVNAALMETNKLHELDQAAQRMIDAIMEAQTSAGGMAPGNVHFGEAVSSIRLDKPVSLAELRRHKRAFLKLATKITFSRLQDSTSAQRMFSDYLREQLGASLVF